MYTNISDDSDLNFYKTVLNHDTEALSREFRKSIAPIIEQISQLQSHKIPYAKKIVFSNKEHSEIFKSMLNSNLHKIKNSFVIDADDFIGIKSQENPSPFQGWISSVYQKVNSGVPIAKGESVALTDPVTKAVVSFMSKSSFDMEKDNSFISEFLFSDARTSKSRQFSQKNDIDDNLFPLRLRDVINISIGIGCYPVLMVNSKHSTNQEILDYIINDIEPLTSKCSLVEVAEYDYAIDYLGFKGFDLSLTDRFGSFNPFSDTINATKKVTLFNNDEHSVSLISELLLLAEQENYENKEKLNKFCHCFENFMSKTENYVVSTTFTDSYIKKSMLNVLNGFFSINTNQKDSDEVYSYLQSYFCDSDLWTKNHLLQQRNDQVINFSYHDGIESDSDDSSFLDSAVADINDQDLEDDLYIDDLFEDDDNDPFGEAKDDILTDDLFDDDSDPFEEAKDDLFGDEVYYFDSVEEDKEKNNEKSNEPVKSNTPESKESNNLFFYFLCGIFHFFFIFYILF